MDFNKLTEKQKDTRMWIGFYALLLLVIAFIAVITWGVLVLLTDLPWQFKSVAWGVLVLLSMSLLSCTVVEPLARWSLGEHLLLITQNKKDKQTNLVSILSSNIVPTEYDVEYTGRFHRPVLIDDRNRRFSGLTLTRAFHKAEAIQDPTDPIHHPPYPRASDVPLPKGQRSR